MLRLHYRRQWSLLKSELSGSAGVVQEVVVTSASQNRRNAPIAALIFDMDGLLVDSEAVAAEALALFLQRHGHELRPNTLDGAIGRRLPEAVAMLADAYNLPGAVDDLIATFDTMRLQALHGNVLAMPGAVALLDWATARGIPRALATSSSRGHADVSLAEASLAGRFDVEVTGDEVQRGKPAPDLFLLAADRLGVPAESCVVLEDSPAGLEAAIRAGMRPVWVPNAHTSHLTPFVPDITTLEHLGDAIPWLESQGVGGAVTER
jgi:HAD superfamily hydrolase (TIGR01509 family)